MSEQVDADSKSGFMQSSIFNYHWLEVKFHAAILQYGSTDKSPSMGAHKIDHFGCYVLSSSNKIAFILTILVVYHDNQLAFFYVLNGVFYTIQHMSKLFLQS